MAPVSEEFEKYAAARGPSLLRLAFVLTGDETDAQDVVQEALSRALPRWSRISAADDPDAYVRRMVVNAHVSWWRKFRRRESPVAEVVMAACAPASSDSVIAKDDGDAIWAACLRLPKDQRAAVVLRYYEELSHAEIAVLTGVAESTARSRVHRGLAALRSAIGERGDGHE